MTTTKYLSIGAAAILALAGNLIGQDNKVNLTDPNTRTSYALGADIGANLKRQDLDLDPKSVVAGITDAFAGKPALTEAQIREVLGQLRERAQKVGEARAKVAGEKNLKEGEAFLAANGKKPGVKTTASGLQYQVLKTGAGNSPKATDTVKVHYHGTLLDGSVFDSSTERGEPVEFPLDQVIPGWTEALQLMKVGDKFKIFLPSKLAYGERSAGPKIGPNSALVFEVELLAIGGAK